MTFDEWAKKYKPLEDGEGSISIDISEENADDIVLARRENRLWTRIEEDGILFIVNGKRFTNRLDYIITELSYSDDAKIVVSCEKEEAAEKSTKFKVMVTHTTKAWFVVEAETKEEARKKVQDSCGLHTEIFQKSDAVDWDIIDESKTVGKITKL